MFASWHLLAYGVRRGWRSARLLSATRRRSLAGVLETAGGALYIGLPCAVFLWLRDRAPEGLDTVPCVVRHHLGRRHLRVFRRQADWRPQNRAPGSRPTKPGPASSPASLAGACAGAVLRRHLFTRTAALHMAWFLIGALIAFTGLMGDLFESFLEAPVRRERRKQAHSRPWRRARPYRRSDGRDAAACAALVVWPQRDRVAVWGRVVSADGRTVSILGVTGSVGQSTIHVIEELRAQGRGYSGGGGHRRPQPRQPWRTLAGA